MHVACSVESSGMCNRPSAIVGDVTPGALLLRQHHPTTESDELTIRAGEVRLDPGRLGGADTPEGPSTSSR